MTEMPQCLLRGQGKALSKTSLPSTSKALLVSQLGIYYVVHRSKSKVAQCIASGLARTVISS